MRKPARNLIHELAYTPRSQRDHAIKMLCHWYGLQYPDYLSDEEDKDDDDVDPLGDVPESESQHPLLPSIWENIPSFELGSTG